jgi:hypothetical protein
VQVEEVVTLLHDYAETLSGELGVPVTVETNTDWQAIHATFRSPTAEQAVTVSRRFAEFETAMVNQGTIAIDEPRTDDGVFVSLLTQNQLAPLADSLRA